jgi:hypothetical protein
MNKAEQFWNWFIENSPRYYLLNRSIEPPEKEKMLNELLQQLHAYSEHLYFEIGGSPVGIQELVITAEGKKEHFHEVENLLADAPRLPKWKFTAFKQATNDMFVTEYEGVILDPASMWFMPLTNERHPDHFGMIVYLKNYTERHKAIFMAGVFKVLDAILGEKTTAEQLQYLDVSKSPRSPKKKGLIELMELPQYIAWRAKKK